ncbi:MAG: type III pantothenate kinase [Chlorobiaceae bacterium]
MNLSLRVQPQDQLLLVVEIGNTTTSFALFRGEEALEIRKVPSASLSVPGGAEAYLDEIITTCPQLRHAALCSVVPGVDALILPALQRRLDGHIVEVSSLLELPFSLTYDAPESLGADRIALCALGRQLHPAEAVILLDIGTAITVDVLGSRGRYHGGLIMPGLELMARALHEHTARLPMVTLDLPESLVGQSTDDCIRNGIIRGCAAGLEGIVEKIRRWLMESYNEADIRLIATGGNAGMITAMMELVPLVEEHGVLKGTRYLFALNPPPSTC